MIPKGHKKNCQCGVCRSIRGETTEKERKQKAKKRSQNGKDNPNYKHGKNTKPKYCIDCGEEISVSAIRCKSCSVKERWKDKEFREMHETLLKGEKNHNYKHGKFTKEVKDKKYYCKDCGKEIDFKTATYEERTGRCKSCTIKGKRNPRWKNRISLICKNCKKIYKVLPSRKEKSTYCSRKCQMEFRSKNYSGENSYNWQGGIGRLPYPFDFNEELKKLIRKRDGFRCQLCDKTQGDELRETNRRLAVHHIDYEKRNLNPNNLISLCTSCNSKVNYNREKWEQYFKEVNHDGLLL